MSHSTKVVRQLSSSAENVLPLNPENNYENLEFLSYDQIRNSNPGPLELILHPWLPKQGIAFVYAATGVGKTLFTLNTAYAIAGGGNFLKFKAPKPKKVLYIDGEMSYVQIYSRFMQIVKQQGELNFKENWILLTPDKAKIALPLICSPEGQEFYNKKIEEFGVEVLFLDNLSTLSAINENDSEAWKIIQRWLINLRAKGVTVVVVHHAGKDKFGYRGTSRMLDCVDTAISLQDTDGPQMESDVQNSRRFKVEYQKHRTFSGAEALSFEVCLNSGGWDFNSMEKSNTTKIIEMFNDLNFKQADIARELNISRVYVSKIIKKARLQGLIKE
jgi:KaiC/GvpD/RAD55 family RecA-like ATPase